MTGKFRRGVTERARLKIYSTKKLKKTMEQKNTKTWNCSLFIYLFIYISVLDKNVFCNFLALKSLLWHGFK